MQDHPHYRLMLKIAEWLVEYTKEIGFPETVEWPRTVEILRTLNKRSRHLR